MNRLAKFLLAPAGWGTLIAGATLGYLINEHVLQPGIAQVAQVQKARTDFAVRCARSYGKIVHLDRSAVSYTLDRRGVSRVCIGPDGRWLEWY